MYGRDVKGKTLTFAVSGQLWNSSLVMIDMETKSLWSHILGQCVHGKLKGEQLRQLIADTMTWKAWRSEHPDTTVLNLPRSSKNYSAEFYEKPERFAYGFVVNGEHFHATFARLRKSPVRNLMLNERPLLLTFNPESTAARLFSRRQDDRDLTFVAADNGLIRDEETGSLWNRTQGIAVDGPLKGTQLGHEPAIITFTHKWMLFHSDSKEVTHSDVGPTTEVPVNDELRSRKATPSETDDASIRLKQSDLDPFFHPPAEYANDFGDYRSPLKFYDGRTVKTAADWQTRRREILARWHKVMGPWPSRIEQPQIEYLEKERRENFTQHHVRVEMAPGLTHPAILLVPDGTGPFPAIVVPYYNAEAGAGLGKELRDFGYQLTKRGFVTLSLGFPSSLYYPSKERLQLQPLSSLAYVAANCHTALANLSYVDAERIGIVGHSYGGKWAMFASCLYEKFACAVWSDGGIVFDEQRANVNYWEPWYLGYELGKEQRQAGIPNKDNPRTGAYKTLVEQGLDLHELHALMAPRPFLVSGGAEDRPQRWKPLNHAIAVNKLLGYTDRVAMTNRKGHSPTPQSNEQIYLFFERFLKNSPTTIQE